jgi:hypothetical protein
MTGNGDGGRNPVSLTPVSTYGDVSQTTRAPRLERNDCSSVSS